jgi:predicted protein tyrosine phosphatase
MEEHHRDFLSAKFPWAKDKIQVLGIPDVFFYRSPDLIAMLAKVFAADVPKAVA